MCALNVFLELGQLNLVQFPSLPANHVHQDHGHRYLASHRSLNVSIAYLGHGPLTWALFPPLSVSNVLLAPIPAGWDLLPHRLASNALSELGQPPLVLRVWIRASIASRAHFPASVVPHLHQHVWLAWQVPGAPFQGQQRLAIVSIVFREHGPLLLVPLKYRLVPAALLVLGHR